MKKIFTSSDRAEIEVLRNLLVQAGIETTVHNESTASVLGDIPFFLAMPEVWITDNEREDEARAIVENFASGQTREDQPSEPWTCPNLRRVHPRPVHRVLELHGRGTVSGEIGDTGMRRTDWSGVFAATGSFAFLPFLLGAIVVPGVIVVFGIGIVEPSTRGWPFASLVCIVSSVAVVVNALGFLLGLGRTARYHGLVPGKVYRLSKVAGLVTMVFPLGLFPAMELLSDLLRATGAPRGFAKLVMLTICLLVLMMASAWLGRIVGRKCRVPTGHCANCGYNLTGNVSGICPECGLPSEN